MGKSTPTKLKKYIPILEWGIPESDYFKKAPPGEWFTGLDGGIADDKVPDDFETEELARGAAIQTEHTDNPDVATDIAMDHLEEHPKYYDNEKGLPEMERRLDKVSEHAGDYINEEDGKQVLDLDRFARTWFGDSITNKTNVLEILMDFAHDLGHVVDEQSKRVYIDTDFMPVHDNKNNINV